MGKDDSVTTSKKRSKERGDGDWERDYGTTIRWDPMGEGVRVIKRRTYRRVEERDKAMGEKQQKAQRKPGTWIRKFDVIRKSADGS